MEDQLNVPLEDPDLLAEVELMTALMIAATSSKGHLSKEDIDQVLDVARVPQQRATESGG